MAEYVDLSERVTATFYSDEYEEWTQQTVTIADVLDSVCDDYTILPSTHPELSQVARDIATIIENEKDMRVIERNDIVRCKDCKHRYTDECPMHHVERVSYDDDGYVEYDDVVEDYTCDDGFCHKNERRTK